MEAKTYRTMENNSNKIKKAKKVLKDSGYYVDNLWSIDDVKEKYVCDNDTAQYILDKSLTNEATMEQIWLSIDISSEMKNLKTKQTN